MIVFLISQTRKHIFLIVNKEKRTWLKLADKENQAGCHYHHSCNQTIDR